MKTTQQSKYSFEPSSFGRVAVLLGGNSAEREISLLSGNAIYEALESAGIDAIKIDKQFIQNLEKSSRSKRLVRLMLSLKSIYGFKIICGLINRCNWHGAIRRT